MDNSLEYFSFGSLGNWKQIAETSDHNIFNVLNDFITAMSKLYENVEVWNSENVFTLKDRLKKYDTHLESTFTSQNHNHLIQLKKIITLVEKLDNLIDDFYFFKFKIKFHKYDLKMIHNEIEILSDFKQKIDYLDKLVENFYNYKKAFLLDCSNDKSVDIDRVCTEISVLINNTNIFGIIDTFVDILISNNNKIIETTEINDDQNIKAEEIYFNFSQINNYNLTEENYSNLYNLRKEIHLKYSEIKTNLIENITPLESISFQGKKVDLMEIIVGMHEAKSFPPEYTRKDIVRLFSIIFNLELNDSNQWTDVKNRFDKKDEAIKSSSILYQMYKLVKKKVEDKI